MRVDNASSAAAESVNIARQEITHLSGGGHLVIDRENTEPEELVGTQLPQERSIRTAASVGSGAVGASGDNQPGDAAIGSYVEIFDAFSPLAQPAKILDFDGSTYKLQHGLSGATLNGIHSRIVHPYEIYEAGSEVRCNSKKGHELSLACKQCTVTGHNQKANGELNYRVDCLNHGGFIEKMSFPLTSLQRIRHQGKPTPWY